MKAQVINSDLKVELMEIGALMHKKGLPSSFVAAAVETAFEFEGVYDLMKMWAVEKDKKEQEEIVADIQDMIDDCSQKEKIEGTYIRFDDLEGIAKNIRTFKDNLRMEIDKQGGLNHLAQLTGIPQPSLSRLFSSPAMPRRNTLLKIAKALNLSQVQIATEWLK
jgi:DNA-binding phage protein